MSKPVLTNTNKKAKGVKLKFSLKLECSDNEFSYKIEEVEYEYSFDGVFVFKAIDQASDLKAEELQNQIKSDLNAFTQKLKAQLKAEADNDW